MRVTAHRNQTDEGVAVLTAPCPARNMQKRVHAHYIRQLEIKSSVSQTLPRVFKPNEDEPTAPTLPVVAGRRLIGSVHLLLLDRSIRHVLGDGGQTHECRRPDNILQTRNKQLENAQEEPCQQQREILVDSTGHSVAHR